MAKKKVVVTKDQPSLPGLGPEPFVPIYDPNRPRPAPTGSGQNNERETPHADRGYRDERPS